ncbi:hypothetical protein [Mesorhizobium sp.]|uniref:hypothetical protein n=1 Tax=Mesorhizobium sp. TaxID=1871066 RepID=UPI0025C3C3E4|nr:hypothetical protein [Mesorhizobium sp.]
MADCKLSPQFSSRQYHLYLGKPLNVGALPFQRRRVLRLGEHEVVFAAPFATHFAPHQDADQGSKFGAD